MVEQEKLLCTKVSSFEDIKRIDEEGREYWLARELHPLLDYPRWDAFTKVIERAQVACLRSNIDPSEHFILISKIVEVGNGALRDIHDVCLSRYACYLIVQNGDPAKEVIALGQTYFALQARRQELIDDEEFAALDEDHKRLLLRKELTEHNKRLTSAAHDSGVQSPKDYAIFQNHGYKGLYGGLGNKEIHRRKGLKLSQKILDHMGHEELAANLFRATQTEAKLRRENIKGKNNANRAHVGRQINIPLNDRYLTHLQSEVLCKKLSS